VLLLLLFCCCGVLLTTPCTIVKSHPVYVLTVVESHPDNVHDDLRLDRPFESFTEFCDSLDFSSMTRKVCWHCCISRDSTNWYFRSVWKIFYSCRAVIFLHRLDAVGWLRESAYALITCKIVCQHTDRCCVAVLGLTQGVAADQWAGEINLKVVIIRSAVNLLYNSGYCAFSTLTLLVGQRRCTWPVKNPASAITKGSFGKPSLN